MLTEQAHITATQIRPLPPKVEQQQDRITSVLVESGDSWEAMTTVLTWIQTRQPLPQSKPDEWKQVIVRGETDGTMGMEIVKELLVWNSNATLILSGGVYGREKSIGDIGAIDLFRHLEHDLTLLGYSTEEIKSRVLIDSLSQHTVDQGRVLSGLLESLRAEDIFIVMPLYHMARFLLTLATNLKQAKCKPNLIPLAYGSWQTHHPRKKPLQNLGLSQHTYTYEELFALPPVSSEVEGKYDCGEIDKIMAGARARKTLTFTEFVSWYGLKESRS